MRFLKPNMMLMVGVELSGKHGALRIAFRLLESDPVLRDPFGVVASDGTIDLRAMPLDPRYNQAVDIVFALSGGIEIEGRARELIFAPSASRAFRIKRARASTARVFQASFPRGQKGSRRAALLVHDSNDDGRIWDYGLAFLVHDLPGWSAQYDPAIINRGRPGGG
jgi:hypothetical protein